MARATDCEARPARAAARACNAVQQGWGGGRARSGRRGREGKPERGRGRERLMTQPRGDGWDWPASLALAGRRVPAGGGWARARAQCRCKRGQRRCEARRCEAKAARAHRRRLRRDAARTSAHPPARRCAESSCSAGAAQHGHMARPMGRALLRAPVNSYRHARSRPASAWRTGGGEGQQVRVLSSNSPVRTSTRPMRRRSRRHQAGRGGLLAGAGGLGGPRLGVPGRSGQLVVWRWPGTSGQLAGGGASRGCRGCLGRLPPAHHLPPPATTCPPPAHHLPAYRLGGPRQARRGRALRPGPACLQNCASPLTPPRPCPGGQGPSRLIPSFITRPPLRRGVRPLVTAPRPVASFQRRRPVPSRPGAHFRARPRPP